MAVEGGWGLISWLCHLITQDQSRAGVAPDSRTMAAHSRIVAVDGGSHGRKA